MHVTTNTAAKIIHEQKNDGKTFAMVSGCFDLLHYGHLTYFNFAKRHADYLVVVTDIDETIALNKGEGRPIMKYDERVEMLRGMAAIDLVVGVDEVYCFDDKDTSAMYRDLEQKLGISTLVSNEAADKFWSNKEKDAEILGINFVLSKEKTNITTSKIIERIRKN